MMEKLIFLDIDGVLNHVSWARAQGPNLTRKPKDPGAQYERHLIHSVDPSCVRRLARIVELTGAQIVLSSSWRQHEQWTRTEHVLQSMGVSAPIIGRTPIAAEHDPEIFRRWRGRTPADGQPWPRGYEIQQWLDEHPSRDVRVIAILDDDPDMEHLAPRLVRTDYETGGLQSAHMSQTIRLLGA